jgi:glycerophosphoryl diester phosphodiesterase
MKKIINKYLLIGTLLAGIISSAIAVSAEPQSIQLGPRPFFLVEDMDASPLKEQLQQCVNGPFVKTDFSIGHRGAALQFPEHTLES